MANQQVPLGSAAQTYFYTRGFGKAVVMPAPKTPRDPSRGYFLAPGVGGSPLWAVTVNGAPAPRTVDLFEYATRLWVRSNVSDINGIVAFDGLIVGREYMAIARDDARVYNDYILPRLLPVPYST